MLHFFTFALFRVTPSPSSALSAFFLHAELFAVLLSVALVLLELDDIFVTPPIPIMAEEKSFFFFYIMHVQNKFWPTQWYGTYMYSTFLFPHLLKDRAIIIALSKFRHERV